MFGQHDGCFYVENQESDDSLSLCQFRGHTQQLFDVNDKEKRMLSGSLPIGL